MMGCLMMIGGDVRGRAGMSGRCQGGVPRNVESPMEGPRLADGSNHRDRSRSHTLSVQCPPSMHNTVIMQNRKLRL